MRLSRLLCALPLVTPACGSGDDDGPAGAGSSTGTPATTNVTTTAGPGQSEATGGPADDTGSTGGPPSSTDSISEGLTGEAQSTGEGSSTGEAVEMPDVDVSDPQLYEFQFTPDEADDEASLVLGTQQAFLNTNVAPFGQLVVLLHGAGEPGTCGSATHGRVLAEMGFHVFSPCYLANYGVGNCDDDIGGCRLEAFEGVDHHDLIDVGPPDSIEGRVTRGLEYLQAQHPGGDWQFYVEDDLPRWNYIVISGSSHGASTSGVIGMNRMVVRVVSLAGPLDTDQAWLLGDPMTPIDRFYGFTHTGDDQHNGHLAAYEDLGLPGEPTVVDDMDPPYGDSHRLVSSAATNNGHGAVTAGGSSPMDGKDWVYMPVWRTMYGADSK